MPSAKLLRNLSSRLTRGSALLITLVMIGIFSIIVGAMLFVVRQNAVSAQDKIAYESAYQTAIAGTHIGRALLLNPDLANQWYGSNTIQAKVKGLVDCATDLSREYVTGNGQIANAASPSQIASGYFNKFGFSADNKALSDGRVVLYDMSAAAGNRIVSFPHDQTTKDHEFSGNIFSNRNDSDTYIDSLRFTTVPSSDTLPGGLNEATLIIEARGVSHVKGRRKERVVQERVLIYPTVENVPMVSTGAAIVGGNSLGLKNNNNSHFDVFWGPVQAKGNVRLLNYAVNVAQKTLTADNKWRGAGVPITDIAGYTGVEKWLKWQAGKDGVLYNPKGTYGMNSVFSGMPVGVTDFFSQLKRGEFNTGGNGWLPNGSNTKLAGNYQPTTAATGEDFGLWETDDDGNYENGALVQGSQAVTDAVDKFFNETMNYNLWKNFAIDRGMYMKPGTGGMVNELNQPLYLVGLRVGNQNLYEISTNPSGAGRTSTDRLTASNIAQLSMKWQLDRADNNPHTNDPLKKIDDRILFIDAPDNGAMNTYDFGSSFFWKGMVYINGNLTAKGAGSAASVFTKDPDQFAADPYGKSQGQLVGKVIMDGIMMLTGTADFSGNPVIYGTLGVKDDGGFTGSPMILYNSANGKGRFKDPTATPTTFQIIAGRISEPAGGWL